MYKRESPGGQPAPIAFPRPQGERPPQVPDRERQGETKRQSGYERDLEPGGLSEAILARLNRRARLERPDKLHPLFPAHLHCAGSAMVTELPSEKALSMVVIRI